MSHKACVVPLIPSLYLERLIVNLGKEKVTTLFASAGYEM
jgi:hypothetical protein